MDDREVFYAMPVYGGVRPLSVGSLINSIGFLINKGIQSHLVFKPDCACIDFARCELLAQFIYSKSTHILWVDADISFDPDLPYRMLETGEDIICGVYKRRAPPHDPIVNADFKNLPFEGKNGEKLFKIHSAGIGCTMISKDLILRMCDKYSDLKYFSKIVANDGYALFQPMIREMNGKPSYLGEDISFFYRVIEMGVDPVCLVDATITHDGHSLCFADSIRDVEEYMKMKQAEKSESTKIVTEPTKLITLNDL